MLKTGMVDLPALNMESPDESLIVASNMKKAVRQSSLSVSMIGKNDLAN